MKLTRSWEAGYAFTTLRSPINVMIFPENRARFGEITVVCGARSPGLLIYKGELKARAERGDIDLNGTVDKGGRVGRAGRASSPRGDDGRGSPGAENALAAVCGPPITIRFTLPVLFEFGFQKENILTSPRCG
ncbi:hypothetical protein HZB60_03955 [candidate division KSB1 bacterium]|nr:hypothetical protein [candidate division KSB1 bacterium]